MPRAVISACITHKVISTFAGIWSPVTDEFFDCLGRNGHPCLIVYIQCPKCEVKREKESTGILGTSASGRKTHNHF